jgi:hypothetical protein
MCKVSEEEYTNSFIESSADIHKKAYKIANDNRKFAWHLTNKGSKQRQDKIIFRNAKEQLYSAIPLGKFIEVKKMKKVVKLFASVFCIAYFISCATIIRGTSQTITINSNVSGASVELDGAPVGVTPFTGKIKKGKDKTFTIRKQGYGTQSITLEREFDMVAAGLGNFVSCGIFGTTTDWANGAMWLYNPTTYFVQLQEDGQSNSDYSNELAIRKFSMINHSQIAIDAGKNGGEYTDALADLMKSKMDKETAMLNIQDALEKSKGDQVVFGNELIESFRN